MSGNLLVIYRMLAYAGTIKVAFLKQQVSVAEKCQLAM